MGCHAAVTRNEEHADVEGRAGHAFLGAERWHRTPSFALNSCTYTYLKAWSSRNDLVSLVPSERGTGGWGWEWERCPFYHLGRGRNYGCV